MILPPGYDTQTPLANYSGDSNYAASTSLLFDLTEVPYTPTVTVTPSSSSITPSQALTVAVNVSAGAGNPRRLVPSLSPAPSTERPTSLPPLIRFAGLLLFGLPIRRKYWQLVLVLCALTGLLMTRCGGGNSGNTTPPPVTNPGTTAGDYVFTVTGTDSSNANTRLSVNVTVSVQ